MSYARFGSDGSDVYVFGTLRADVEVFECCGCMLVDTEWVDEENAFLGGYIRAVNSDEDVSPIFNTTTAMIKHLEAHLEAGHCVPQYTFEELMFETEWGTR